MLTLTEAAYYTRRFFKYAFIAIIALIILRMTLSVINSFWRGIYHPPPRTLIDARFGKLPPIKFPSERAPTEPITYTQEFIGGTLPESSPSAIVYFTPKPSPNFLSLERAKDFAKNLGFQTEPVALSQTLYQWTDTELPLRYLKKDIVTGSFSLNYDFYKDPTILTEKSLPYGKAAISEAFGSVGKYGLDTSSMDESNARVSFWKSSGSQLLPAPSVSEADIVRVDLFRTSIHNFSLVTPNYREALVYFLFSGSSGKKRVLSFRYIFRTIEQGIFANYPIKTTKKAWEELEAGKGYIANWGAVKGTHATIRKVYLAYYDSYEYEPYLQPVFVFEGDEGFVIYVSAVTDDWVEQSSGN